MESDENPDFFVARRTGEYPCDQKQAPKLVWWKIDYLEKVDKDKGYLEEE